jgi:hypothetical protein
MRRKSGFHAALGSGRQRDLTLRSELPRFLESLASGGYRR